MSWTPTLADFVVLLAVIGALPGLVIMRPQMPSPRQSSWLRLKALGTLLAVVVLGGLWLLGRLVGSFVNNRLAMKARAALLLGVALFLQGFRDNARLRSIRR